MGESGEMYLETILVLHKEKSNVRAIDVADHMNYSKPSVSRGLGLLKRDGYITVDETGYIKFTAKGKKAAEKIYERHHVLSGFLSSIGVDDRTAAEDACRIEHVISDKSFNALKKYLKK
ncbi:MAG: metal-dependent transcriptional regulator [Lachnospiraceae bacterium]|nr:metal-dependent transcriptional regulator [Lachnospiraceae bacterium]